MGSYSKTTRQLRCHGGKVHTFPHKKAAGLYCSKACQAADEKATVAAAAGLQTAGFTVSAADPNVWTKDGVMVTTRLVKHLGLETALEKHAAAVAKTR